MVVISFSISVSPVSAVYFPCLMFLKNFTSLETTARIGIHLFSSALLIINLASSSARYISPVDVYLTCIPTSTPFYLHVYVECSSAIVRIIGHISLPQEIVPYDSLCPVPHHYYL